MRRDEIAVLIGMVEAVLVWLVLTRALGLHGAAVVAMALIVTYACISVTRRLA